MDSSQNFKLTTIKYVEINGFRSSKWREIENDAINFREN